jgi:hypothetical protein
MATASHAKPGSRHQSVGDQRHRKALKAFLPALRTFDRHEDFGIFHIENFVLVIFLRLAAGKYKETAKARCKAGTNTCVGVS